MVLLCDGVFKECMEVRLIGYAVGMVKGRFILHKRVLLKCTINSAVLQYELNSIQLT
jgi:hypothetical protein